MSDFDAEAALRRLVDEADVSQVILRYADGVDRRRFDQVWDCFAPGAYVSGSSFSGPLDEYLPRLLEGVQSFGATQHFMGNQLRTVDGDRAHTETYAVARHFRDQAGEDEVLVMGVRYVDDLIRLPDGRWVIAGREATAMWRRS
jgi:SnoaL-like domain